MAFVDAILDSLVKYLRKIIGHMMNLLNSIS